MFLKFHEYQVMSIPILEKILVTFNGATGFMKPDSTERTQRNWESLSLKSIII